jgi:hypothetical protein
MNRSRSVISALTGEFLWAVILIPILAISWLGFYTVARAVGVPVVFAAGMSAAFDGVALFAARIGLKHRRKGFSGYLARITVVVFVALGAFVQSYHGEAQAWIHAHSWIVWATAPVAACVAYELHLGWVHRKRLIAMGYTHPSAKSGFGPATWIHFPWGTMEAYREGLLARRRFIAEANLERFAREEAEQPELPVKAASVRQVVQVTAPIRPAPIKSVKDVPDKPALKAVPNKPVRKASTRDQVIREWCRENGYELGYRGHIPVPALNAYRAAHRSSEQRAS